MTIQNGVAPVNSGGGGISCSVNTTLKNIRFLNNSSSVSTNLARTDGGAINVNGSAVLTIESCIFDGNYASRGSVAGQQGGAFGGAISGVGSSSMNISNSTFTNNVSGGGTTNLPSGTAIGGGGAIYFSGSCVLTNCTFQNNKASFNPVTQTYYDTNGNGGALLANNQLRLDGSSVFENNIAGGSGGGIYKNGTGTFTTTGLTSFTLTGNRSGVFNPAANTGSGGGIYTAVALSLSGNNITIAGNAAFGNGGGINATTSLALDGIHNITNNSATYGGGAINVGALTLKNVTISGNKAGYNPDTGIYTVQGGQGGGGIQAGGALTMSGDIVFQRDSVAGYGGAIFWSGNSTFNGSQLTSLLISENATVQGASAHGGGIMTRGGLALMSGNITIRNNSSVAQGGGINNSGSLALKGNVFIQNNVAAVSGGGIHNVGTTSSFNTGSLISLSLTGNRALGATGRGGGIYTECPISLAGYNGVSISDNFSVGYGGGIYSLAANLTLDNINPIINNISSISGGGIYATGLLTLKNISILGNKAGYDPNTQSWLISGDGGGVYSANDLVLQGSIALGNDTAVGNGGAIYKTNTGSIDVTGLTSFVVKENATVNLHGGGIYTNVPLALSNKNGALLVNNYAKGYGGEVRLQHGPH